MNNATTYMRFGAFLSAVLFASAVVGAEAPAQAPVQQLVSAPAFPTKPYFKRLFQQIPENVDLQPPVHLADYIVDGKLELSLKSFLDTVMANNTDISIQKLTVDLSRDSIVRAYSIFDPNLFASFSATRTQTPANDALAGAASLNALNQPAIFRYSQLLSSGAQYNVLFNASKSSTNSAFSLFNPALSAGLNANFSQPLLRGRGRFITKIPITIARSRLRASEYGLQDQVLQLVSNAENAYWDVISARENVRVQEQAMILADTSLKRAQRELELGAISPLDIYQPEAVYANYQIQLSQARFRLQQTEDILRKQMGADLDPDIRKLPIVLTEQIAAPPETTLDKEALVGKALTMRPDLKVARQNIDVDELGLKLASNGLLPNLSLTGQYGAAGRGGPFTARQNVFAGDGTSSTIISTIPGGFTDALDQLFGFGFPVYGFGLTLNLPIRDRKAAADYADAVVARRLDMLKVRNTEQSVRLTVLNAISQVENSKAGIDLAKVALDLAQKRADAEQKKYDLGTTTLFFLLDAQTALNQAQSALVNQTVQHRKDMTNLLRFTGDLLPERGIAIQ
jgi:outer membrane protein